MEINHKCIGGIIMSILLFTSLATYLAGAEENHTDADWSGERFLTPVSAPYMALEAVNSGASDGTIVSIGAPTNTPNQKWIFTAKGLGWYSIHPSYNATLALTVNGGDIENGTQLMLAADKGLDWQLWSIRKNSNGSFSIIPKHAPTKGIDDFGGGDEPGSKIDIWDCNGMDQHLQWYILDSQAKMPVKPEKGRIIEGDFNESRIFPGTVRKFWVYVPKQYDPSKPACVYVQQDGYGGFESKVFDALISNHEMPVTVGVFVSPGYLPAPKGVDTFGRSNRNFEYDALGSDYVRFIIEELLPHIAKKENLNLSTSGNDRCIAGGSSGGICAFNAAWERPDAFTRVYACSGSFVAFRGGNEFPTLVRKYEAKPIRAFLTTGTNDMENCAGDWTLIDMEMDKSLKFSGYDYIFQKLEGGHGAGWGPDGLTEAMRFLWKGWPEPVKAGAGAPRSQDILIPGEQWQLVSEGNKEIKGSACNSKGEVFFIDASGNQIYRIGLDGKMQPFINDAGHANSLSFGANDELYTASISTGKILSYDKSGKGSVYASGIKGRYVIAKPDGGVYVTAPGAKGKTDALWFVKPGYKTVVDNAAKTATGLAITPDRWLLALADGGSKWIYSYQINGDGSVSNRERFFWLYVPDGEDDAGTEALCYDKEGHLFAATRLGIQVCADYGPTQIILPMPGGRVTGLCFGGSEIDTLFAFCGNKIYKRKVKTHALGAFTPWTKMTPGQL